MRRCRRDVVEELARIIGCVLEAGRDASRARGHRFVPAGAVDDRCRDRGASGIPGAGDRGEVRPARQAHRGATSTSATSRYARPKPCSQRPPSTRPRSTSSCTTARCGRTTRSGRPRRGSRTGSAARTPSRSSTTTSRWGRRSRCGSRETCSSPSRVTSVSSSRPAASRTCSTTGTSARGSCSTSATARSPLLVRDDDRERGARLPRDHGRLVLAPGEGPGGGSVEPERRTASSTWPTRHG